MQKIDIENWKDIVGYEGKYQVSDLGNVRSLNYHQTGEVKVLKFEATKSGYVRVMLSKGAKRKRFSVHTLVITTFRGPIPPGMQVNHLNEIKTDNRLSNLEVVTPKQNNNWGTRKERAAASNKGRKHTEESKRKMSASRKGKPSNRKGKTHSEEAKAKMSAAKKGQTPWNKGKPRTPEEKAKMAAAAKAYWERKRKSLLR